MKVRYLVFISLFFFLAYHGSAIANANFNGIWKGVGRAFQPSGEMECQDVEIRLHMSDGTFTFRGGHYHCGYLKAEYPYTVFNIKNGRIFEGKYEVGSMNGRELILSDHVAGYELKLSLKNHMMSLKETWVSYDDFLTVEAFLVQ